MTRGPLELTVVVPVTTTDAAGLSRALPVAAVPTAAASPGGSLTRARHAIRAAELAGLDGVHVPYDLDGDDSWVVAAGALRASRHIGVTVELHPASTTPVYAAKMSSSLQRFSHGRLGWAVVVETDETTARAVGDRVPLDEQADRADEFLTVARAVWTSLDVDFEGRWYDVLGGGLRRPLDGQPLPQIVVRGTSPGAVAVAARHADWHVVDLSGTPAAEQVDQIVEIEVVRREQLAARTVPGVARTAVRVPVVARADRAEAEADAARADVSSGAIVGSYADVADHLAALSARGVGRVELVLAPAVAETYRIGEWLVPRLHDRSTVNA